MDTRSDEYKKNFEAMTKANDNLDKITKEIMHVDLTSKQMKESKIKGKLLPRERINALVDPGTPFLELS